MPHLNLQLKLTNKKYKKNDVMFELTPQNAKQATILHIKKIFFWSTWKIKYTQAWLPTYPRAMQFILSHQKLIKTKPPSIDDRLCAFVLRNPLITNMIQNTRNIRLSGT